MLAFEMTAPIANHRLVIQNDALPANVEHARVIVIWEAAGSPARRTPPLNLAGMGEEKGDILNSVSPTDWEALL